VSPEILVGHKAVSPYLHSALAAPFGKKVDVSFVIFIPEENLLTPVPSLSDVMRITYCDDPCQSCHDLILVFKARLVKK